MAPNRLTTKKAQHDIAMLLKMGALEADEYGMYRITESGDAALSESMKGE